MTTKASDKKAVLAKATAAKAPRVKVVLPVKVVHTLQGPLLTRVEEGTKCRIFHRPAFMTPSAHPSKNGSIIVILQPVQFASQIEVAYGASTVLGFSPADAVLQALYARFEESPPPVLTLDTLESALRAAEKAEMQSAKVPGMREAVNGTDAVKGHAQEAPPVTGEDSGTCPPIEAEPDASAAARAAWALLPAETRGELIAWSGSPELMLTPTQQGQLIQVHLNGALRAWDCPDCKARCFDGPVIPGLPTLRNVNYAKYQGRGIRPASKALELCDSCRARFDEMDTTANGSPSA